MQIFIIDVEGYKITQHFLSALLYDYFIQLELYPTVNVNEITTTQKKEEGNK